MASVGIFSCTPHNHFRTFQHYHIIYKPRKEQQLLERDVEKFSRPSPFLIFRPRVAGAFQRMPSLEDPRLRMRRQNAPLLCNYLALEKIYDILILWMRAFSPAELLGLYAITLKHYLTKRGSPCNMQHITHNTTSCHIIHCAWVLMKLSWAGRHCVNFTYSLLSLMACDPLFFVIFTSSSSSQQVVKI